MSEFKIIGRIETGGDGTPTLIQRDDEFFMRINGFPDYFISDEGNVVSNKRGDFRMMRASSKQKYYKVTLQGEDGPKQLHIHRLVAEHFLQNPEGHKWVRHIDEDSHNNAARNLEWADPKTTCNAGTRNERIGNANRGRVASEETKKRISEAVRARYEQKANASK